ncbi:MAG: enoyl-CoA hydratase/isomerase family protein [SAR324 cluster bacterium]|nr:enoyl-CoA hydratase/isomerase family protein [SAR324 cluster bacterium]MBL7035196.1 enoyl-CoA hydratase/isomerase family protein [SAR324 cluster bacterium]
MSFKTIILEINERKIATLTLNRPDVHNALSLEMIRELRQVVAEINANSVVRGVILTGSGKSFCAGADLRWMQEIREQKREDRIAEATELSEMLGELDQLKVPLIGRINGLSFGGAVGLIACCDIAVAVEEALFSLTEVLLGLLPATISPYVLRRIGAPNARRVMLNAHRFSAEEAVQLNLIAKTVPANKLDEAIGQEIKELLCCAPEAVSAAKRLIAEVRGKEPDDVRSATIEKLANAWESDSIKEGIDAFFSKRKPAWNPEA